ncbi:hypothetical protein SMGES_48430 [Serratia marcescens]|nr:hypothetical protein SMGES_48430 [Serratia marcescens]
MAATHPETTKGERRISGLIIVCRLEHEAREKTVMKARLREEGAADPNGIGQKTYGSTLADRITTGLVGTFW